MKSIYGAFALVVSLIALPGLTLAAPTGIAQLPILNLDDTGSVKPNLMLLYDNSGSMGSAFTPDYIDDSTTCRTRVSMAGGTTGCVPGHPPFHSADFNRQYYNPKVTYLTPVDDLGISYPSQTTWTSVKTDAFGVNTKELVGNGTGPTNLVTGFPDLTWCDDKKTNCGTNTTTYTYPTDTVNSSTVSYGNPYYYTIKVAEFCSDANLTKCTMTGVDATAPAGYPFPAKVRWCDSTALTNCQAKYVGNFKYPRFSRPTGSAYAYGAFSYGTITIGTSGTSNAVAIRNVSVVENNGTVVITNGSTPAANGTTTLASQAALAESLAASIVAKTGLTRQYTACVYKPSGAIVPACSTYGISLPSTNTTLAVIPIACSGGATGKGISQCAMLTDTTRSGWALVVDAPTVSVSPTKAAVATLVVNGKAVTSNKTSSLSSIAGLSLNGTTLFGTLTFSTGASNTAVATAIATAINDAKVPNVTASVNCGGTSTSTVCISTTASYAANQFLVVGAVKNPNSLVFTPTNTTAGIPATNMVPTTTIPLGAGAAVFVRTDIISTNNSYVKGSDRSDCSGADTCTYAEEMTNFANWYTYYRTRNQMMKTSVGLAFKTITASFNVGIVSLSVAANEDPIVGPKPFSGGDRASWYTSLYNMNGNNSTPLRPALNAVGKMYANVYPYVAATKADEVVQYPCQQNYTFMTTDGYWNGAAAKGYTDTNGTVVLPDPNNNDNVERAARFCLLSTGCVDSSAQTDNSLADVALYWYNGGSNVLDSRGYTGSLRPEMEPAGGKGLVIGKPGENTRLHMNTYTLGLGVDGIMNYEENYDTGSVEGGDFYNLTHAVQTGCPWNNNGKYIWPDPKTGDATGGISVQARVDDLWHTAINGHGKYFSASSPDQVISGLRSALSNITAHSGAAAAAATSTPNISIADNDLFSVTFTTVQWSGELTDKKVNPITGEVLPTVIWSTSDTLGLKVGLDSDTRKILMLDTSSLGNPVHTFKNFSYDVMTATEKAWFNNKCSSMAQCNSLDPASRVIVNNGESIVDWLRGQQQYADNVVLRAYGKKAVVGSTTVVPVVLGDIASSKPVYVRYPLKSYADAGYAKFVTDNATRKPAVYVGSNDGMLHAFDSTNGNELWAYVPRVTMKKLYKQADTNYGTNHQYTVDGSPEVGDVMIDKKWRSVLVGGFAGGGRGYYAIDVTDRDNPVALWETCADATVCTGINNEPEMGLSFGNPQTGTWKNSAGDTKWVVFVTSGYNNVPDTSCVACGSGKGWLMVLDIATGEVLAKTATTGNGDVATPSGLARITGITLNPTYDPKITYVYGGDVLGQMWRFDLTANGAPTVVKMADAGVSQPITARPDVTYCEGTKTVDQVTSKINRVVVGFGTGRLLSVDDLSNKDMQSLYVFKDTALNLSTSDLRGGNMLKQTLTKVAGSAQLDTYTSAGNAPDLSTQLGWYVDFDKNPGERVNLDPMIALGGITVITNIPDASTSCKVGGSSVIYTYNVCSGKAGPDGTVGTTVPGGAAAAGASIVSTSSGLVAEVKLVNGVDVPIPVDSMKTPVSRRSGWRRLRD